MLSSIINFPPYCSLSFCSGAPVWAASQRGTYMDLTVFGSHVSIHAAGRQSAGLLKASHHKKSSCLLGNLPL